MYNRNLQQISNFTTLNLEKITENTVCGLHDNKYNLKMYVLS